jgi:GNAT superfamily N-acetyltransferase
LRDFCTAPFIGSLKPDVGLRAFARLPEREHQLLRGIAERPDSIVTLAYTQQGVIVGQVTLAPADTYWQGLANAYEIAIEVSTGWRRRGIAQQLLKQVFELDCLDDLIIIAMGLSWHWDTDDLGLTRFAYRAMIERLFAHYGFTEYLTSEGNIRLDPANIFLARLGRRVATATISQFYDRLLQSDTLPGM